MRSEAKSSTMAGNFVRGHADKLNTMPAKSYYVPKGRNLSMGNMPSINESDINDIYTPIPSIRTAKARELPLLTPDEEMSRENSRKSSITTNSDTLQKLLSVGSNIRKHTYKRSTGIPSTPARQDSHRTSKNLSIGTSGDEIMRDAPTSNGFYHRFSSVNTTALNQTNSQFLSNKFGFQSLSIKTPVNDYDKPLNIVTEGVAQYHQTMKFINELEAKKLVHSNQAERLNFMRSQNFSKFLTFLKDYKLPKIDDDNFYGELENQMKEEMRRRNFEMKISREDIVDFRENEWNEVFIEKSRFKYFSIMVRGCSSPMRMTLKSDEINEKISVFVSKTSKKPSRLTCDKAFESKGFKIQEEDKSPFFKIEKLYFGIISDRSGMVQIKYSFQNTETVSPSNRAKLANPQVADNDFKYSLEFAQEIAEIKQKRKAQLLKMASGANIVKLNKILVSKFRPETMKKSREHRRVKSEVLIKEVLAKKQMIDRSVKEKKINHMVESDNQRAMKRIQNEMRQRFEKLKARKMKFLQLLAFINLLNGFRHQKKRYIEFRKRRFRISQIVLIWTRKVQRAIRQRGDSHNSQLGTNVHLALQLYASHIKAMRKPEAHRILVNFLKLSSKRQFLVNRCNTFMDRVRKLQHSIKNSLRRKNAFKKLLLMHWDQQVGSVTTEFYSSNPKHKRASILLEARIDENIKMNYINKFLEEIKEKYRVKYNNYITLIRSMKIEERKQHDYGKFFMIDKMKSQQRKKSVIRTATDNQFNFASKEDKHKEEVEEETEGYMPSGIIRPPKMMVFPTQEELRGIIRNALEEIHGSRYSKHPKYNT